MFDLNRAGMGGSDLPDLKAEFSDIPHQRGTLSMARSQDPNSANSQFFICFAEASHLDRSYTVFGKVIEGMELIDNITKGDGPNGSVSNPDNVKATKILEGPGIEIISILLSINDLISSCPGSDTRGVPASEINAIELPSFAKSRISLILSLIHISEPTRPY